MTDVLLFLLHCIIMFVVLQPFGYLIDRMEKIHRARERARLIETYGEDHAK